VHKGECKEAAKVRFESAFTAAEAGDSSAQYRVGVCYYFGHGVLKDATLATTWFHRAAEAGDANAQYNLGVRYNMGDWSYQGCRAGSVLVSPCS